MENNNKIEIKNRKIAKSGRNHSITVPKVLIDANQIDPEKKYTMILIEENEEKAEVSA